MAFAGLSEESLAQMSKEGVKPEVPPEVSVVLPDVNTDTNNDVHEDINLVNPDTVTPETTDEILKRTLAEKNIKIEDIQARLTTDKGFTPEYIAELKTQLDPAMVDHYVAEFNREVEAAKVNKVEPVVDNKVREANKVRLELNNYIYNSVGGQEKFSVMSGVLKTALPQEQVDIINAKLRSDSKALITEGLSEAVTAYKRATGRSTVTMTGDAVNTVAVESVFITKEDYHAIIRTEKYKTDPTYAAKVDADRLKSKNMDNQQLLPGIYRNYRGGKMYNV